MNSKNQANLLPAFKLFGAYLLLVTVITLLPGKIPYETVRESGPVETLSAYGYFLFCLFIIYFNLIGVVRTHVAPGFFVLLLGLRELDFHAKFTTMGMFKSRFFISPEVPLAEKVIVTVFIIFLLAYGFSYLRKRFPSFRRDIKAARPYAISLMLAVVCLVTSKLLDGNSEIFESAFYFLDDPKTLSRTMEECMEMFIPVFLIRALIQYAELEAPFVIGSERK